MARNTARPEPGIASDKELEAAADALWDAVEGTGIAYTVECDRFDHIVDDDGSEVINVRLENGGDYEKTQVINAALNSDAPVKLRSITGDDRLVTFYPTNQKA